MKEIFVVLLILISQIDSYAQSKEKDNCFDSTRYVVKSNISYFPEIKIKIDEEWKTFELIDERAYRFDYECEEIELTGNGSKELVIRWKNAIYGSGGGSTTTGIQIWDLDNGTRLFNEIVSCSEQSFGRNGNPSYFIECQKQIEFINQTVKIYERTCTTEWSDIEDVPDPTSYCTFTAYEEGEYVFVNGELKKK